MKKQVQIRQGRGGGYTLLSLLLLFGGLGLLLWRCQYSFCWSDESFYLSTVHRFWLGDAPFRDEWNTGQLYAVLLLPFYGAWRALAGSTEGIYLAARVTAVLLIFAEALGLWLLMRRRWPGAALAGSLLVLFYAKANLSGLSYYTLAFFFFFGGLLILYGLWQKRPGGPARAALLALAGVLEALAVVCMPFAALLWLAVLVPLFLPRLKRWRSACLWLIAGAVLAAAVYLGWVLSRVSLAEILENLPWVLSDPDSNTVSLPVLILKFFAQPFYQLLPGLVLWGPALAFTLWARLRGKEIPDSRRQHLFGAAAMGFVLNILGSGAMLGRAHLALCVLGLECWLLLPAARRPRAELAFFGLPGFAFAFIWQIGSNTGFSGMTLGFAVMVPFGAACLESLLGEAAVASTVSGGRVRALLAVLLILPVAVSAWQRVALVYRDAPLSECMVRLEEGPAWGLYTSPGAAEQYTQLCQVLAEDSADAQGPIFISALAPWAYLCTDRPVAAPTTWRIYTNSSVLEGYYQLYPQRQPQTVLILNPEMGAYVSTIQPEENSAPNTPAQEGFLLELLEKEYTAASTPVGTLYRLKSSQ